MEETAKRALAVLQQAKKEQLEAKRNGHVTRMGARAYRMEKGIAILWGMYRGWTFGAISYRTCISISNVEQFKSKLARKPATIFDYPVLHTGVRGSKTLYRCELCGDLMVKSEKSAREHVAGHFFSKEVIKTLGVGI